MGMCMCEDIIKLVVSYYHNEKGEPTLSLIHALHCDHMGGNEQILSELPLGLTTREFQKLPARKKLEMLTRFVEEDIARKLLRHWRVIIKRYSCPYDIY